MVKRITKRAHQARENRQAKRVCKSTSKQDQEKDFVCEICGDSYDTVEKLTKHLSSNKVWNQGACFKCPKCDRGFHTEPAIDKHVAWAHPELLYDRSPIIEFNTENGIVKWKCLVDNCNASFDQHISAQVHEVREHRDFTNYERNYQCQECNDFFETTQDSVLQTLYFIAC